MDLSGGKTRILLWGINYAPEVVGIAVYNTQLSRWLQDSGMAVTVVTAFPYYPQWKIEPSCPLFASDRIDGVRVERCLIYVPGKPTTIGRIVHELLFGINSFLRALWLPRQELYVVVSPPLILGFFAALLCLIKSSRFVFHVQDLQPDAAAALGMIRKGLFYKCLKMLEVFCYSRAAVVSCITEDMRQRIVSTGVNAEKVKVFPNWIQDVQPKLGWRESRSIPSDKIVVTYSGNIGQKQGLEVILHAARRLRHRKEIVFVLGGEGSQKQDLMDSCKADELENVLFQGLLEDDEHTAMLSETDLFALPQKNGSGPIFFPSKLLKALALGCPIITNADSRSSLHAVVEEGQFGVIVPPDDGDRFADAIVMLCDEPATRSLLSERAKSYSQQFRSSRVLPLFNDLIAYAVNGKR